MSQYGLDTEQRSIYDQAFRFAREQLAPLQARMDDEDWFPPDLLPLLGRHGYLGITAPAQYGGAEMDLFSAGLVGEAISYWNFNVGMIWGPHENLCLNNILRSGSESQRRHYLPKLISGEWIGALGLTEPGAGSDALGGMHTTARRDGDCYVLNGTKMFISNGPVADVLLIYAKTAPERGAHGISAFIVEQDMPGFSVAQKLKKMGWRGCPTGELVLDNCRVPAANLVGQENMGVAVVMSGLDLERAFLAMPAIGVAQRCLDLSIQYASTRKQFSKTIGSFQFIQGMLAEMYTDIEAARTLSYRTLMACDTLEKGDGGRGEIHKLCAASVMMASNVAIRVADMAVQIHGGNGFMWETEVNRAYRNVRVGTIGAGTTEIRKLIIAEELLCNPI